MALDQALIEILVCPDNKSSVKPLSAEEVERLNQSIRARTIKTRAGAVVSETVDGALIRADKKIAYAVRGDIPVMLISDGLLVDQLGFVGQ